MKLWIVVGVLGVLLMVMGLQLLASPTWAERVFYFGGAVLAAAVVVPSLQAIRSVRRADKSNRRSSHIR